MSLLSPRHGGPVGRKPHFLQPMMPELRADDEGLPALHFEPPVYPTVELPPPTSARSAPSSAGATASQGGGIGLGGGRRRRGGGGGPLPPPASDAAFAFLRGDEVDEFVGALEVTRPGAARFAYFRETVLADMPARGLAALPNPFELIALRGAPGVEGGGGGGTGGGGGGDAGRYLTVNGESGVTLWVGGEARESYSIDEWRDAHASFARVARERALMRARAHLALRGWLASVQRIRGARRRAALLMARREAPTPLEALAAPAAAARALAPAADLARRVCGWIRAQAFDAQQTAASGASRPPTAQGGGAPITAAPSAADEAISLGAANGPALSDAIGAELHRVTGALISGYRTLTERLEESGTQPLATPNEDGCKYLLQTYSRRLYPVVASAHFNTPLRLFHLQKQSRDVAALLMPPARPLHKASAQTLERWISESSPRTLSHTARRLAGLHHEQAARYVRQVRRWRCGIGMEPEESPQWRAPNGEPPMESPQWRAPKESLRGEPPR